jgi:hypothetical protein
MSLSCSSMFLRTIAHCSCFPGAHFGRDPNLGPAAEFTSFRTFSQHKTFQTLLGSSRERGLAG